MRILLGAIIVAFLVVGCSSKETPSATISVSSVTAAATRVATTTKVWTLEELKKNTIIFKQDTGFAVDTPYQGTKFRVEYQGDSLAYWVGFETTTLVEYRQVKVEAEKVFASRGLQDLCSVRIFFVPPKALGNQIEQRDTVPAGCGPYPSQ